MKKFILKCLLFVAVFFIFDKAFIIFRYLSPKLDFDKRLEHVLEGDIHKDILIFGSSRGTADILPWMLEDSLGLTTFNLSYGGGEIMLEEFILEEIIKNHEIPKYIILLLDDDFELYEHDENAFRADRLQPLVKYPDVRKELVAQGELNPVLSRFFILAQLKKSNYDLRNPISVNDTVTQYGNLPEHGQRTGINWDVIGGTNYNPEEEVEKKKADFIRFQQLCIDNDIKLIMAVPPSFRKLNKAFYQRMQELTVPGIDLIISDTGNPVYSDTIYFKDTYHLNMKGATVFTEELIDHIKSSQK